MSLLTGRSRVRRIRRQRPERLRRKLYVAPIITNMVPGIYDCGRLYKPYFDESGRCNCVLCSTAHIIQSESSAAASAQLTARIARARGKG
jgi:hypothetical protein